MAGHKGEGQFSVSRLVWAVRLFGRARHARPGVLLARAGRVVLAERRLLVVPVAACVVLLLVVTLVKFGYCRIYMGMDYRPPSSFNETAFNLAGIHRAFVYDEPGVLAYYSDIHLVPLDGLMGDIAFQHELATKGVNALALEDHIDGFIGPSVPYDDTNAKEYCEQIFLSAVKMNCVADGPGKWQVVGADVYSRVPSAAAGTLKLDKLVWNQKDMVTVWKINPSPGSH